MSKTHANKQQLTQCSFFRITDTLLPFDSLSILILDKLCIHLLCLYRFFSLVSVLISLSYFCNVTSTYYMEMK